MGEAKKAWEWEFFDECVIARPDLNNGVSPEMAVRLEKAFGGTADSWLALQQAYDLAQVERTKIKVRRASSVLSEARV